jgi:PAS domain S-box-containing protein
MPNKPPRILVVDDNPATLYATSRVLRSVGWEVVEAATGGEAMIQAATGVDIVVLDVNLPDFDGFEVCRRLRALPETTRIPVIHLSATFVNDIHKVQGLDAGADGYLTHPVEPPVLVATVNAFLRTRQAENDRRQTELEFRAVFENALNGISLISRDFRFVDVNPAMCGILQQPRDFLVGRPIFDFVPAERTDESAEIFKRLELHGVWRGVFPLKRADGPLVYLDWSLSTYSDRNAWLAIVSDITGRLQAEREREESLVSERAARGDAERANRLKDDFLATLSHELRTPLNAIVGWAQLLKLGQLSPSDAKEAVDAIDRNAKIQAQMIADLLDVSRITSGKLSLEVEQVDPAMTVEAAIVVVAPAAEAKGICLTKVLDPQAGPVAGDPARLQQVVWNLVNNAVKFTPNGGKIEVRLERVNSHIEISVADTGQGISADLLPWIFERFRQGDAPSTRVHGGLGLGLAIAKQLVEIHGGTIRAESSGEEKGAKFTVSLPVSTLKARKDPSLAVGPATHVAPAFKTASPQLHGIRVLIVDDDADARRLTKRVLADFGAEPAVAEGVNQALVALDAFRPHILISDLGMPNLDGFELIRQVRAHGYTFRTLPAIALTAYARTEDRRKALLAGFQLHLTKPVDPAELSAAIASLVGRTG